MDGSTHPTRPAVLVLLGPPGACKGTQAKLLQDELGLVHLSTGDLLRDAAARGPEAGRRAQVVMDAGRLVPDEIVLAVLKDRLAQPDVAAGVILDGFPRTPGQAEALDELLAATGRTIDAAISLEVDDAAMVTRVAGRFSCETCGEGYHDSFKIPAVAGTCDRCGSSRFKRRADDSAATVAQRLTAYHAQTAPLIGHYERQGVLVRVDAMRAIDQIARDLRTVWTVARA